MNKRLDVVAIVRRYEKNNEKKNVYSTLGSAFVSEDGSISISLDTVPVSKEWNGRLYLNEPYEKKEKLDDVVTDIPETPDLGDIPF